MKKSLLIVSILCSSFLCSANEKTLVGAIRWDAWTGGNITNEVEKTLGPKKYHNRLPWFAKIIDDQTVKIDGSPQSVMDKEIHFAANAGLDYWAFLIYDKHSSMSVALNQYLNSEHREKINFCMILYNTLDSHKKIWPQERDRMVQLLKHRGYLKVLDGRPLVYAFRGSKFPFERYRDFLAAAKKAGLNPYSVYMTWEPAKDFEVAKKYGFDAVSAYALGGNQTKFKALAQDVEKRYWLGAKKADVPCVPLVTTGWDKNPRKDNPVFWEKGSDYHKQKVFPSRAKPGEIAEHFKNSINFVKTNPKICSANTVIFYAWNEYDEGGWLAPTIGSDGNPDDSRLKAIKSVIDGK